MATLNVRDANTGDFVVVDLDNPSGVLYVNDYNTGELIPTVFGQGINNLESLLISWATSEAFELLTCTYDPTDVMVLSSATVKWPDGSSGTFTTTSINATWKTIDSYTVTHANSGLTITQALVTRDSNGLITIKPALTVA